MNIIENAEPKERILNHAEDKFLQYGFNKVTLDEMSSDLGISKKTMYKFFPSKEELLRTIIRMLMKKIEREFTQIRTSQKPFIQKLADMMELIGRFAGRISKSFQSDIRRFAPTVWNEMENFRKNNILIPLGQMIKEAKKEGIFRNDINEEVVIMMFIHSVQSIVNPEVLSQNSFSPKEAMHTIFHVIFEGSLTDEARTEFLRHEYSSLKEPLW